MMIDPVWNIEEPMLNVYLTLVHRIEGIGLSLNDFWEMDTWTLSKIYLTELELIEEEEKNSKKGKTNTSDGYIGENNPEVEDLFSEMFEDDED